MAGGGIHGGTLFGSSTPDGGYPASDPVSPDDVAATVFHCLGIEHRQIVHYVTGVMERLDLPPGASYALVSTFAA